MLLLSRRIGEEVLIGDDVVVTVVEISGGRVRLGIIAPKEVAVDRREVRERQERSAEEGRK